MQAMDNSQQFDIEASEHSSNVEDVDKEVLILSINRLHLLYLINGSIPASTKVIVDDNFSLPKKSQLKDVGILLPKVRFIGDYIACILFKQAPQPKHPYRWVHYSEYTDERSRKIGNDRPQREEYTPHLG